MAPRTDPYRVLLVDSLGKLEIIARPLFEQPDLVSAGNCTYGSALRWVHDQQPELILVELSGSEDAFEAIESVMAERPTPIVALHAGDPAKAEPFRALALGALDVVARPVSPPLEFWKEMAHRLRILAQVRVVQHVRGKRRRRAEPSTNELAFPVVSIAASLGGPKALCTMLRMLPANFPAPICVCQHISQGFTTGFAQWLRTETHLKVFEALDGEMLQPGSIFVAPSGSHLLLRPDGRILLDNGPPVAGFKPSCDLLLSSTAKAFGRKAIGVVMTGMGKDGALGLKEIRARGGQTIAQDESTSVVYGMPREAAECGAAQEILPLEKIAAALLRMVNAC